MFEKCLKNLPKSFAAGEKNRPHITSAHEYQFYCISTIHDA
jgi:hypothetical protein